jgi:hypothetical protein
VSLHLSEWEDGHDPFPHGTGIYLYVDDADALHAQWRSAGVEGRLATPHDTPYRLREFAYVDPDGTVVRVGSPLAGAADGWPVGLSPSSGPGARPRTGGGSRRHRGPRSAAAR